MGMGPARRYAASLAVAVSACGVWAPSAWGVAEPVQNCPGSTFPYTGEFSFPVAAEGFADDCQANIGSAFVDARTGALELDILAGNGVDTIAVDPQGRLTHLRTPNAGVFDLAHPTGVVASVSLHGSHWIMSYDVSGRLIGVKGPSGTTSLSYNAGGRVSRIALDNGTRQNFGYNATGRLTSFTDSGADTGTFTYDGSGRLTKLVAVLTAQDPTESFTYDGNGDVLTWSEQITTTRTLTYMHDAAGDVTLAKNGAAVDATMAYAAPHRLSAVTGPGNAPIASFTYDTSGRLSTAQGPLSLETFSYNGAGRLSSTLEGSMTTTFSYDALGRLTGWTDPNHTALAIAYLPGPASTTGGPISVRSNTATLTGRVNPRGAPTAYHFQYGLTTAYGHATPSVTLSAAASAISVVDGIKSLRPATTYHYRVLASNRNGSSTGLDRTFHTQPLRCRVPKLKGDTLGQAKRALKRAHCRLGRVHRPRHVPHGARLKVSGQRPSAGAVRPQGTKVAVKLSLASGA